MGSRSDPPNPPHNVANFHGAHNYGSQFGQHTGPINFEARQTPEDRARELAENFAGPYRRLKDDPNPRRVPGTCAWFISDERFAAWRDADDARLLHVFAKPGCGKSVLARALVDEDLACNPRTAAVLYFFFKAGNRNASRASSALTSMVHQLYGQHPEHTLNTLMLPKYASYGKHLAEEYGELWDVLIDTCNALGANVTCIIDAVDECEETDRHSLLTTISAFYSSNASNSTKLKCLVMSRPYREIDFEVDTRTDRTTFIRFDGDEKTDEIAKEINLVIQVDVPRILPLATASTRATVVRHLRDMQNQTYLWLRLTLQYIKENLPFRCTEKKLTKLLQDTPADLYEMYENLLSRFSSPQHPNHSLSRTLFAVTIAAERPLTVQETQVALVLSEDNPQLVTDVKDSIEPEEAFKKSILDLSGHLLTVQGGLVYFLHQTVREFLLQKEAGDDAGKSQAQHQETWKHSISMISAHDTLAGLCLQFLTLGGSSKFVEDVRVSIGNTSRTPTPPINDQEFLEYTLKHWSTHWRLGTDVFQEDTFPKVYRFLDDIEKENYFWWSNLRHSNHEPDYKAQTKWQMMAHRSLNKAFEWSLKKEQSGIDRLVGGAQKRERERERQWRINHLAEEVIKHGHPANFDDFIVEISKWISSKEKCSMNQVIEEAYRMTPSHLGVRIKQFIEESSNVDPMKGTNSVDSLIEALCAAGQYGLDSIANDIVATLRSLDYALFHIRHYYHKLSNQAVPRPELGDCWAILKILIDFLCAHRDPSDDLLGAVVRENWGSRCGFKQVQNYLLGGNSERLVHYVTTPEITPIEQRLVLETILKYPTIKSLEALVDHHGAYSSYAWELCFTAAQRVQQPKVAEFLLDKYPSNFDLHTYNTAMWTAARQGDRAFVAQLLSSQPMDIIDQTVSNESSSIADLNYDQILDMCVNDSDIERFGFVSDIIYAAAAKGRVKTFESLLKYGLAKGMRPREDLPLALEATARDNHIEMVERLLEYYQIHGNLPESSYRAALYHADVNDHIEVRSLLLDKGPEAFRDQYARFYLSYGDSKGTNEEGLGDDEGYVLDEPWSSGDDMEVEQETEVAGVPH